MNAYISAAKSYTSFNDPLQTSCQRLSMKNRKKNKELDERREELVISRYFTKQFVWTACIFAKLCAVVKNSRPKMGNAACASCRQQAKNATQKLHMIWNGQLYTFSPCESALSVRLYNFPKNQLYEILNFYINLHTNNIHKRPKNSRL